MFPGGGLFFPFAEEKTKPCKKTSIDREIPERSEDMSRKSIDVFLA